MDRRGIGFGPDDGEGRMSCGSQSKPQPKLEAAF